MIVRRLRSTLSLGLTAVLTLPLSGVMTGVASPAVASSAPPTDPTRLALVVESPGPITKGSVVRVGVVAANDTGASAFQVSATTARGKARIVGADTRAGRDGAAHHRDMSIADLKRPATLAAYSTDGSPLPGSRLGGFDVRVKRAGQIELRIGAVELSDRDGRPMSYVLDNDRIVLDVLTRAMAKYEEFTAAPELPWSIEPDRRAPKTVTEIELEWQERYSKGRPCKTRSAKLAGGCLTIADVQRQATDGTLETASTITPRAGMTFTVRSRGDEPDARPGNGVCATSLGTCTLRAAIQEANAIAGADTVAFDIPGSAPYRIQLTDRLPGMWNSGTTIDGYTQPGATPNSSTNAFNGRIMIEVVGAGSRAFDGLVISSGGNTVRGLSLYNLRRPIWVFRAGRAATPNVIRGNFVGTDPSGTAKAPSEVDLAHGIHIEQDSANTIIGGPQPAHRNVISGNARHGIGVWHMHSDNTVVKGNIIGLAPDGVTPLPNWKHGVDFNYGASDSIVGGTTAAEANVISANRGSAVEISHTRDTARNDIVGNIIGADRTGSSGGSALGSGDAGIRIEDGVTNNIVRSNVIVNSARGGIRITNVGLNGPTTGTVISGNWIGVAKNGTALPNRQVGVSLDGSDTVVGPDNRIERNQGPGVTITELDAQRNTITRNRITGNSGLQIDIAPIGSSNINDFGDGDEGPNGLLNSPEITSVNGSTITGRACPGCRVEIFTTGSVTRGRGPLDQFRASIVANGSGVFTGTNPGINLGAWVAATATDPAGNTSEVSWNVLAAASNQLPTVDAGPNRTIDEGAVISLTANASDADGDSLRYAWDLDGDGTFEALGRTVSYRAPAIAPAQVEVVAEVVDDRGGRATDSAILTIRDAPDPLFDPEGRVAAPSEVIDGDRIALSVSALRDPDSPSVPIAVSFDCGNGFGSWGSTTSVSCPPRPVGLANLGVRLRDDEGSITTYPVAVVVRENWVSNSGFESGTTTATGWSHPTTLARTTSLSRSGTASIATTTATTAVLRQTFDIPSARFEPTAWVSITGDGSVTSRVRWYDANGTLISTATIGSRSGGTGGWVSVGRTVDAPGGARRARVEFAVQTASGARVAIDDVSFTHASLLSQGGLDADNNGDGRPDGWWLMSRFTSTTETVLSGPRAGRAESDGTSFTPGQAFSRVNAGAAYHLTGWVHVPRASDVTVRMGIRWRRSDGTSIRFDEVAVRNGSSPGWVQLSATRTAPSGASQGNLEIRLVGLRGVMYLDQFTLTRN
jgi:CSLREA domain-containing protein